jgi:hypothetical protein
LRKTSLLDPNPHKTTSPATVGKTAAGDELEVQGKRFAPADLATLKPQVFNLCATKSFNKRTTRLSDQGQRSTFFYNAPISPRRQPQHFAHRPVRPPAAPGRDLDLDHHRKKEPARRASSGLQRHDPKAGKGGSFPNDNQPSRPGGALPMPKTSRAQARADNVVNFNEARGPDSGFTYRWLDRLQDADPPRHSIFALAYAMTRIPSAKSTSPKTYESISKIAARAHVVRSTAADDLKWLHDHGWLTNGTLSAEELAKAPRVRNGITKTKVRLLTMPGADRAPPVETHRETPPAEADLFDAPPVELHPRPSTSNESGRADTSQPDRTGRADTMNPMKGIPKEREPQCARRKRLSREGPNRLQALCHRLAACTR